MPRNRAVDYPPVHRPTVQPQLGLAPPQLPFAAEENRFSWQETPIAAVSPNAERELELAIAARKQENRQTKLPPLPVLPQHLGGALQQQSDSNSVSIENPLPSQRSGLFPVSAQNKDPQNQNSVQEQQATQFRPDIPRNWQQAQHQGPTPSYEASQAAYNHAQDTQAKMQEQAVYPGPYNLSNAELSAHALPFHQRLQPEAVNDQHQSTEEKPSQHDQLRQPRQPKPVHVGPDENPLSPKTPVSPSSPSYLANTRTFPQSADMQFPQPSSYTQPQFRASKGGTWHHSLGSCAEPTTCMSSLFCPCIIYGRTQYRLSRKSAKKDPTNLLGYSAINGSCVAWSVLCGVNILLTAVQHTRVRKAYEMESQAGNVAGDCVKSICCCCCIIAQDEKEIRIREEGNPGGTSTDAGYKSPGEMTFAAPPR